MMAMLAMTAKEIYDNGDDDDDGCNRKEKSMMAMLAMMAKEIYDNGDDDNDSGGDGKRS
jgi:hypothetical protein